MSNEETQRLPLTPELVAQHVREKGRTEAQPYAQVLLKEIREKVSYESVLQALIANDDGHLNDGGGRIALDTMIEFKPSTTVTDAINTIVCESIAESMARIISTEIYVYNVYVRFLSPVDVRWSMKAQFDFVISLRESQ